MGFEKILAWGLVPVIATLFGFQKTRYLSARTEIHRSSFSKSQRLVKRRFFAGPDTLQVFVG